MKVQTEEKGVKIVLLGTPQVWLNGAPVTEFLSDKVRAILFYLAATDKVHMRTRLAALCWADMPDKQARKNLRQALYNLQKLLSPHLEVTRKTVQVDSAHPIWVDVLVFRELLAIGTIEALQRAVELYGDDLLTGFSVADAPDFESWMLQEQEHLRQQVLKSLRMLVEETRNQAQEIEYLQQLVRLEPWAEEEQRQLMGLLAWRGDYNGALRQYQQLCKALEVELGVSPMPDTKRLWERVQRARLLPRDTIPLLPLRLVGRKAEMAHLRDLLAAPSPHASRLITISGPGGIGKTHLALTVAHEHRYAFLDGVWWVPLATLSTLDEMVMAIAQAIRFDFQGYRATQEQLWQHLRSREMLLVLDNSEHLLSDEFINFLLKLLARAPLVRLLLTSRERLHLRQEQVLELGGLSQDDEAIHLFVERARLVHFDFQPSSADKVAIRQISQLVEGTPLALELAASLTDLYTCQTIATELMANLDALATTRRDVPRRQRSIRAAFDYSWRLLQPQEQQLFAHISIFHGGFTLKAAQAIAQATPLLLRALSHKSLIRFDPTQGRYAIHDLLRQYASEQLHTDAQAYAQIQQSHTDYFAGFLFERNAQLQRAKQGILLEVGAELDNIRGMWSRICREQQIQKIATAYEGLSIFYDITGRSLECKGTYELALRHVDRHPNAPAAEQSKLLCGLLICYGNALDRLGEYEQAAQACQRVWEIGKAIHYNRAIYFSLLVLGRIESDRGEFAQAEHYLREGVAVSEKNGNKLIQIRSLFRLGESLFNQGKLEAARSCYEQTFRIHQIIKEWRAILYVQTALGTWEAEQGDYEAANQWWEKCLTLARTLNAPNLLAETQAQIGYYFIREQRYTEAEVMLRECLTLLSGRTYSPTFYAVLHHLSHLYTSLQQDNMALPLLHRIIWLADQSNSIRHQLAALLAYGNYELSRGDTEPAKSLLCLVAQHRAATWPQARMATQLLEGAGGLIPVTTSPKEMITSLVDEAQSNRAESIIQGLSKQAERG